MTKLTPSLLVPSLLALGLSVTPADAQTRVFVGISGNDANPCTVVAPCRTLAAFAVPSTPEHVDLVLNVAENEMCDVERTFHRRIVL